MATPPGASTNPVPINGVQAFDTVGWATGGSDDPNPHQYLFYKDPTANMIRILESTELRAHDVWTKWKYSRDVITPAGTIRFSDTTQIAAASTFGLGYSGSRKTMRVFVYCEDGRIRDYIWYPGALSWKQGDLSRQVRLGGKIAAQGYDHAGVACFSLFYQDNEGWVHECRKYGADEWHFQTVGEMSGNNYGLWLNVKEKDHVLKKRVVSQNLALDAQLRDYTYDATHSIWKSTSEYRAGIPNDIPETFRCGVTLTGIFIFGNPADERIYFNRGDHTVIERARINGEWVWNPNPIASDAKPNTPLSSMYFTKDDRHWINVVYINDAGNLAQSEYNIGWLRGGVIEV